MSTREEPNSGLSHQILLGEPKGHLVARLLEDEGIGDDDYPFSHWLGELPGPQPADEAVGDILVAHGVLVDARRCNRAVGRDREANRDAAVQTSGPL